MLKMHGAGCGGRGKGAHPLETSTVKRDSGTDANRAAAVLEATMDISGRRASGTAPSLQPNSV